MSQFQKMLGVLMLLLSGTGAAWAQDASPICSDRPGRNTGTCTPGAGTVQLELGLFDGTFQRRDGITSDLYVYSAPMLKYGITDSWDIEGGLPLYQQTRTHGTDFTATQSGIGDFVLSSQWNFLAAQSFTMAVRPYVKLPTADDGLGNGAMEEGVLVPMAYDLGGGWGVASTPEVDVLLDASGRGRHARLIDVLGLTRAVGSGITLGAEIWTAQNFDPIGTASQYTFDLTAAWLMDNDTQFDAGVNLGLNKPTPDLEIYAGISRRF
ncbi:MAG: transporter [Rhizomicrobium sp.]